ncbi:hypothetical protein OESDEN_23186 [Oesophagostomum dentatum]|uniref:Dynactin subunit 4 n=1 Tax=Oesophagostomum dentatum TaxID=61180 RepID=A0A0B1RX07_OESDE|nr:hypothetical protein OESDEN_23186 [Oesophagostomum dentatum]
MCKKCRRTRLLHFLSAEQKFCRCISCSLNEIDSTFCPNCLENIPAGEARIKRNRCVNCNQCPVCCLTILSDGSYDKSRRGVVSSYVFNVQMVNARFGHSRSAVQHQLASVSSHIFCSKYFCFKY